eukprot:gene4051-4430_t
MRDYNLFPSSNENKASDYHYQGRGIQYILGFHHHEVCRGWITMTDSHYLQHSQGIHGAIHSYYLGCPMADYLQDALYHLLTLVVTMSNTKQQQNELQQPLEQHELQHERHDQQQPLEQHYEQPLEQQPLEQHEPQLLPQQQHERQHEQESLEIVDVRKEKLILIDPDYFREYSPFIPQHFILPDHYQAVLIEKISSDIMANLFQRAEMILDFGLPGPERMSNEAILFGAIPIIAERWNGKKLLELLVK